MQYAFTKRRGSEQGFSILEMMLATIILLVGLVAIAQLVPASILMNYRNRNDSTALVFAQRELDQFLDQPLNAASFTDADGNFCSLGDPALPNQLQPPGTVVSINNQALIDFSAAPVANFNFLYPNPATANPTDVIYDVRWAVIITGDGTKVYSKRFILGIRQQSGNGYFQPITVDTMVEK